MTPLIDVFGSQSWYIDHLRPVHEALGEHAGELIRSFGKQGITDRSHPILVASWGDMGTVHRLGYHRIALMQHGAGQSYDFGPRKRAHPSYAGGVGNEWASLFLSPNKHAADRWRKAYPGVPSVVIGCPKLDTLPKRRPGPGPVVAVSFHWNNGAIPETLSVLNEYQGALRGLAQKYTVIGHGHPRRKDLAYVYRRMDIEHMPSFTEILERADVYVFDNSSSGFEFAATGRPVVVLNGSRFRRDVNHGLRFWDAAGVGVNVDRPVDLIAGVERALDLHPADVAARERALDIVYQPRTGGARLAADALVTWAFHAQDLMLRPRSYEEEGLLTGT